MSKVAEIYQYRVLDSVVRMAKNISDDFFRTSHKYTAVSNEWAENCSKLCYRFGRDPEYPNDLQRYRLSSNVVVNSCSTMVAFRREALRFLEHRDRGVEDTFAESFSDQATALRDSLRSLEEKAVTIQHSQLRSIFDASLMVLKSEISQRLFGISGSISQDWPFDGDFNIRMAYVYEEIFKKIYGSITRVSKDKFLTLQRVAYYGGLIIDELMVEELALDNRDKLIKLAGLAYNWTKGLQDLNARLDISRAWKDPRYLRTLDIVERDITPPNPGGEISLDGSGLGMPGADWFEDQPQSWTMDGEICCCSGFNCSDACTAGCSVNCSEYCGSTSLGFGCQC